MINMTKLDTLLLLVGLGHFGVLLAASLVPFALDWKTELAPIPLLHPQMYMTYGGYVVMSMILFVALCLAFRTELTDGSTLARVIMGYGAIFWGVRLCLQPVFDVTPHLDRLWKKAGYHALTLLFAFFTAVFAGGALGWLK